MAANIAWWLFLNVGLASCQNRVLNGRPSATCVAWLVLLQLTNGP